MKVNGSVKVICQNKKAHHDYFIDEVYECGIVLTGTEIKSIRMGKVNLIDGFCYVKHGEMFVSGLNISKYDMGNIFNHTPDTVKKLLMHKSEIIKLSTKVQKDGYTLIPLKVYLKDGLAKMEIALAKGKKLYDKREAIKKEDQRKEARGY